MPTSILSKEPTNLGRQLEVDITKVFAILTMIFIHLFEEMPFAHAMYEARSPFYLFMEFCGGPLSAPLFMSAMGIGLVYSRHQAPGLLAKRGLRLIGQGYVLNVLRAGIPLLIAYDVTQDGALLLNLVEDVLVIDILHFAGMAFLFFAWMRRLKAGPGTVLLVSIALSAIASLTPPFVADSLTLSSIVGLLLYQNHNTYFALCSWLIYPVAGYCLGLLLQRVKNKARFYGLMLAASAMAFVLLTVVYTAVGYDVTSFFGEMVYYVQGPVISAWILLICGMAYSLFYALSRPVSRTTALTRLIQRVSAGVNDIFVIQWLLINWFSIFLAEALNASVAGFVAFGVAVTAISISLALLKQRRAQGRPAAP